MRFIPCSRLASMAVAAAVIEARSSSEAARWSSEASARGISPASPAACFTSASTIISLVAARVASTWARWRSRPRATAPRATIGFTRNSCIAPIRSATRSLAQYAAMPRAAVMSAAPTAIAVGRRRSDHFSSTPVLSRLCVAVIPDFQTRGRS